MYERFTDRARRVMQFAQQEAWRFNHEYIGTEHILLGLVKEGSGVAACVLKNLQVDLRKIRLEIEKLVQSGPAKINPSHGKLPQTPRTKRVIEFAIEESRDRGDNHVGTEHILLGLIRETEGIANTILANLGVNATNVKKSILKLLGHTDDEECRNAISKITMLIARCVQTQEWEKTVDEINAITNSVLHKS